MTTIKRAAISAFALAVAGCAGQKAAPQIARPPLAAWPSSPAPLDPSVQDLITPLPTPAPASPHFLMAACSKKGDKEDKTLFLLGFPTKLVTAGKKSIVLNNDGVFIKSEDYSACSFQSRKAMSSMPLDENGSAQGVPLTVTCTATDSTKVLFSFSPSGPFTFESNVKGKGRFFLPASDGPIPPTPKEGMACTIAPKQDLTRPTIWVENTPPPASQDRFLSLAPVPSWRGI